MHIDGQMSCRAVYVQSEMSKTQQGGLSFSRVRPPLPARFPPLFTLMSLWKINGTEERQLPGGPREVLK